eukprot:1594649-Alexandrium_andersonii.AAC.1
MAFGHACDARCHALIRRSLEVRVFAVLGLRLLATLVQTSVPLIDPPFGACAAATRSSATRFATRA